MIQGQGVPAKIHLILICVAAIGFATPVFAQLQPITRDLHSALRVIHPLVRNDPPKALAMLRSLYDEYPASTRVLQMMGDVYQAVGEVDSARVSYERCLRIDPANARAGASLGLLYVKTENRVEGERIFEDLLSRTGHSPNTYRVIGSTLSNQGYFDMALKKYQDGRARHKANYILTIDIAYLLKLMGDTEGALLEYVTLVKQAPRQQHLARNRMLDLLRGSDDSGALLDLLAEKAVESSAARGHLLDILSNAYLDAGRLEAALEAALEADEEGDEPAGRVLFTLADRSLQAYRSETLARKNDYFSLSLRSLQAYLEKHPNAQQVPKAKIMLSDLLVDLASGRVKSTTGITLDVAVTRSLEALDWLIRSYPGTEHAEEAYLKKSEVLFRVRKQPDEAIRVLKEGELAAKYHPTKFSERLGQIYLVTGDYDRAREYFGRLIDSETLDLHEAGVFYSGLLLSFSGEYETARDTLTALAESNPSSPFTNDAIELAWVIEEGLQGQQDILKQFVIALKAETAADTTFAVRTLKKIAETPAETPLRSRALLKLGDLYVGWERYKHAVETFEQFVRDYPTDIQLPDVYRRIGRVYEFGYKQTDLALKTYETILLTYPHYIFLDEVREDVRRLRVSMEVN